MVENPTDKRILFDVFKLKNSKVVVESEYIMHFVPVAGSRTKLRSKVNVAPARRHD